MRNIPLNFLPGILRNLGVCWRLMQMPTVSPWIRFLLPLLILLYFVSPIDLIPGVPIDDWVVVLIIFPQLMMRLAPPAAVAAARQNRPYPDDPDEDEDDAIEAPWQIIK